MILDYLASRSLGEFVRETAADIPTPEEELEQA